MLKNSDALKDLIVTTLEDLKAQELQVLDVRGKTSLADYLVIATGTSSRHVMALAEKVVEAVKHAGFPSPPTEGMETAGWVLIDASDVIVHIFQPDVRAFYSIEKIWSELVLPAATHA